MAAIDPLLQSATDAIGHWIDQAVTAGWLPDTAQQRLTSITVSTPSQLFDTTERPLVVGLFGGTGVGKSTLLNRIARQDIAHASAARPTSTSVTAYLHHSRHLDRLPTDFPMDKLATVMHHEDRWRDVLWLDMPDVDSIEEQHHQLVMQWLPYTDVLLYVVNPERYRDSRGWSLLRKHSRDHAWMFVFNQRDRGTSEQLNDLHALLTTAGFKDPAVFATSSLPGAEDDRDDLQALTTSLVELSDRRLINDLADRGVSERLGRILDLTDELTQPALGGAAQQTLSRQWSETWKSESPALANVLRGRIPAAVKSMTEGTMPNPETAASHVFDAAGVARVDGVPGTLLQTLDASGELPRAAARLEMTEWRETLGDRLQSDTASAVGQALARPGTPLQRGATRVLEALHTLLPVAALGWAAWRILEAFLAGATDASAYLGVNFAVTAGLLVGIAWALPWWLGRRIRPKPQDTVARGLNLGIEAALARVNVDMTARFDALDEARSQLTESLAAARVQIGLRVLPGNMAAQRAAELPEALHRLVSTSRE